MAQPGQPRNENPRGFVVVPPRGTSLLHSSTVIAPNHLAFPVSLASSQSLCRCLLTSVSTLGGRLKRVPNPKNV